MESGRSEPISTGPCQCKSQRRILVAGCHILGVAGRRWAPAAVWELSLEIHAELDTMSGEKWYPRGKA